MKYLKDIVRSILDFPQKGIIFRDITPILSDPEAFQRAITCLKLLASEVDFDVIVAPEARGFIFGSALAHAMGKGFVPVRKKGKLPFETIEEEYALEYGTATLQMHKDAIQKGQRVVIVDDLLATGGTVKAICKLVERLGGEVVRICCLIELPELNGREVLKEYDVETVIEFDGK